jgi:hypothetical protein
VQVGPLVSPAGVGQQAVHFIHTFGRPDEQRRLRARMAGVLDQAGYACTTSANDANC